MNETQLSPIAKVRAAFRNKRNEVRVDAWDLTLFFLPLTTADIIAIDDRKPASDHERNVLLIILKAELEDGAPAFTYEDRDDLLRRAEYVTMQFVLNHLFRSAIGIEDAKKKSEPIAGSDSDAVSESDSTSLSEKSTTSPSESS